MNEHVSYLFLHTTVIMFSSCSLCWMTKPPRSLQQDVDKFSDVEKLYLYLKLPSGSSSSADKRWAPAPAVVSWHADDRKDSLQGRTSKQGDIANTFCFCPVCLAQWPDCPVVQPHAADARVWLDQRSSGGIPRDFSPKARSLRWIQVGAHAERVVRSWLHTCKKGVTFAVGQTVTISGDGKTLWDLICHLFCNSLNIDHCSTGFDNSNRCLRLFLFEIATRQSISINRQLSHWDHGEQHVSVILEWKVWGGHWNTRTVLCNCLFNSGRSEIQCPPEPLAPSGWTGEQEF